MNELIKKLKQLMHSNVKKIVDSKIKSFKMIGRDSKKVFKELCFCILTANFNAERSIKIQKIINNGFLTLEEDELTKKLKELGHRFPKTRASYIITARKQQKELINAIKILKGEKLREWLIKNIKGLGYKEASHFLRNIGIENFAIIDFHILDLLERYKIIKKPKTLTKKSYLNIEEKLRDIAKQLGINLGELDLYLWYMETGKILK